MSDASVATQPEGEIADGHLVTLAQDVLAFLQAVSASAREMLVEERPSGLSALAIVQSLTSERALRNLADLSDSKKQALLDQLAEPAVARVLVADEDGAPQELFISRGTPYAQAGGVKVASYRSPLGRFAALPVGAEHEVLQGGRLRSLELIARAELRPFEKAGTWDALNTVIRRLSVKPITVVSLRTLLTALEAPEEEIDAFQALFRDEQAAENVLQGLRRSVVQKMALRDQPLLDALQDAVFRLPLSSRVVLLGPPGSGKTTTLIKRLGLKLDLEYLESDERARVALSRAGLASHAKSWLMFTPTELLKQYVKEAFGKEGVPVSEQRMKTWTDYRRDLARNRFGILRTSRGSGAVLKDELPSLLPHTPQATIAWFEDFEEWQRQEFWADLETSAARLSKAEDGRIRALGARLGRALDGAAVRASAAPFLELERAFADLNQLLAAIHQEVKGRLRRLLWVHVGPRPEMLDELASFLETLDENAEEESEDIDSDADEDEEGEAAPVLRGRREQTYEVYARAISADARAAVQRRRPGRRTRTGRIIEWLGDRVLQEGDRAEIGRVLLLQGAMRRFRNPIQIYLSRVPIRYRRFRAIRQAEGRWYEPEGYAASELGPLEVDLVLLAILSSANRFLHDRSLAARTDDHLGLLAVARSLWCNQVVVDEATDFSPVQLACMAALIDPATGGFVACGDFNQRITTWGSRSADEMRWVFPDLDLRPITITYRHSRQLNDFAHAIAALAGDQGTAAQLPNDVDNEGVPPVLGLALANDSEVAWLSDRIVEIERFTGELPSIAVLVDVEAEVGPLAIALDAALLDKNIRAVPCPNGQVVGRDNDVRVFSVEHIKGLEFEAVFFVGIDKLAQSRPASFDKHLYVGATRAAMYLGVTCAEADLPPSLRALKGSFATKWG